MNNKDLKFRNKYRVSSARLREYDYASNGAYFVTICTKDRKSFFGEITNGKMELSKIGKITFDCWQQIPHHFPFVDLGEYIIMPNHVHGLIVINKNNVETLHATSVQHATSLPKQRNKQYHGNNFALSIASPCKYSLSSILRSYKSAVSKNIRKILPDFSWQSRFYDRIIRNENEYNKISEYIINNHANWEHDENFKA